MVDAELRDEYATVGSTQDAAHAIVNGVVERAIGANLGAHGVEGLEAAAELCLEGWTPPSEFRLKLTIELLGHLGEYVADHRFRADSGCYFN
jgi:hypothetical protein